MFGFDCLIPRRHPFDLAYVLCPILPVETLAFDHSFALVEIYWLTNFPPKRPVSTENILNEKLGVLSSTKLRLCVIFDDLMRNDDTFLRTISKGKCHHLQLLPRSWFSTTLTNFPTTAESEQLSLISIDSWLSLYLLINTILPYFFVFLPSSPFAHFSATLITNTFLVSLLSYIAMASSANIVDTVTHDTSNNPIAFNLAKKEGLIIIPQPPSNDPSKVETWQRKILIPFMMAEKRFTFHGPLQTKEHNPKRFNFFPCFTTAVLAAFEKDDIIDLKFMDPEASVLRSMPTSNNKEYLAWFDMMQNKRQAQWNTVGIFDAIQISRHVHRVNSCMLLSSLYFWEGSTNTFHLSSGMPMPILFDVAVITDLSPLGETFDPTHSTENKCSFKHQSLKFYIVDHHVKDSNEVSNEEHTSFLTLWLSYYVFVPTLCR